MDDLNNQLVTDIINIINELFNKSEFENKDIIIAFKK